MKAVILAIIGVIAAAMGYFAFQGECPGGQVFAGEAECRARLGAEAALCGPAFRAADVAATLDYAPFPNQTDCQMQFPVCQPHARVVGGFVPVPRGVCVAKGKAGTAVYERYGQRIPSK
ncbi:MAG: hypothetical protein FD175_1109 [Beijerinckiaceae bacterium]|nr:MAG: hypothetical protein FD175_1109 [Beijerinckiaceae bacterium]